MKNKNQTNLTEEIEKLKEEIKRNYEKKDDKMFLGRRKDDTYIY